MYLAEFGEMRQACLRIAPPHPDFANEWWAIYETLCRGVQAIPDWSVSLRLIVTPGQGFEQTLILATTAANEAALRSTAAAFLRLAVVAEDSVAVPLSQAEYDMATFGFPRHRVYVDPFFETIGGQSFACDFRASDVLADLTTQAHLQAFRFGYQINLRAFRPSDQHWKDARKNIIGLQHLRGVSADLLDFQLRLAEKLGTVAGSSEEYVAVDTSSAAAWLTHTLDAAFQGRYGRYRFGPLGSRCVAGGYEDQLTSPWFEQDGAGPDYACSRGVAAGDIVSLLKVHPGVDLAARYLLPPRTLLDGPRRPPRAATGPPRPHAFVSYKRDDASHVGPLVTLLRAGNFETWYDAAIPGGMQWMDELEAQLRGAFVVVLLVSPQSVASPYVKLELTYALSLQIPIVPVVLEPVQSAGGIELILRATQQLDARSPDFTERLIAAVTHAYQRGASPEPRRAQLAF